MEQPLESKRPLRIVESEPGEGWIEGEYRFKSHTYDYMIYHRGSPGAEIGVGGERARKAYSINNPNVVMGWEVDPAERGGLKGVIVRDYVLSWSAYAPQEEQSEKSG